VNDVFVQNAGRSGAGWRLQWLERVRWQLGLGLLVCIVFPAIARYLLTPLWISAPTEFNSLCAATIATAGGYMFLRRLHVFPGINELGYVMPCFSAAFALVVLVMFAFRLDYSRIPLFISYALALSWFGAIFLIIYRDKVLRLAIVPGGEAEKIGQLENVQWQVMRSPSGSTTVRVLWSISTPTILTNGNGSLLTVRCRACGSTT
jgi:hypothetical protein